MNPIELGKFLANLRNEKNLTQEELADKLFIDKRKVSRWECGTSIPEFDILIKLSEILDVSLYELSICKRLDKENISKKVLNKFKSIKDFKKYKLKKKLLVVASAILLIVFSITLAYTIRNHGTVSIYTLDSLNDDYYIDGNYIQYEDNAILNISSIAYKEKNIANNKCDIEIYDNNYQLIKIVNNDDSYYYSNKYLSNEERIMSFPNTKNEYTIKVMCKNKNDIYFPFKFKKNYSNKLLLFK